MMEMSHHLPRRLGSRPFAGALIQTHKICVPWNKGCGRNRSCLKMIIEVSAPYNFAWDLETIECLSQDDLDDVSFSGRSFQGLERVPACSSWTLYRLSHPALTKKRDEESDSSFRDDYGDVPFILCWPDGRKDVPDACFLVRPPPTTFVTAKVVGGLLYCGSRHWGAVKRGRR